MQTGPDERSVDATASSKPQSNLLIWWLTFLFAFALYTLTANKGPQWQDSGEQQIRMMEGRIDHMHGIALMHPVHYYLGRWSYLLLPLEAGFAITLVSACAAAMALANLAVLLGWCNISLLARCTAVGGLMLAHTFVEHATHTESYMLVAALLTTEWLLLSRYFATRSGWWLVALFFVNGVAIANHMLAALAGPVYAVVLLGYLLGSDAEKRASKRLITALTVSVAWLIGLTPLLLVMYDDYQVGHDLVATLKSTAFGTYANDVANTNLSAKGLALSLGFCAYNFPNLLLPLIPWGLLKGRRVVPRGVWWCLLAQFVIYGLFVIRYSIADQYSYFFIVYVFFAFFAAFGLDHVLKAFKEQRARWVAALVIFSVAVTPAIYARTAHELKKRGILRGMVGNKPYRNGYQAFFVPWGAGDTYAQQLNSVVKEAAGENGIVLFTERMTSFAVRYEQIEGRLPDDVRLRIIGAGPYDDELLDEIRAHLNNDRQVILVPRDRDHPPPLPGFELKRYERTFVEDIYWVLLPH